MAKHLIAYYASLDPAGSLTKIAAVSDQAIRVDGNDVVVPTKLPFLLMEAALSAAAGPSYAQFESPTLRMMANQDVQPIIAGVVFGSNPPVQYHGVNPRPLKAAESLTFSLEATGGVAAANYGVALLGDGPVAPVNGEIFTVRATAAITLVAGSWVNGPLTFDSTLPAGSYNVVGMRAVGTNLIAARLVFPGEPFRPGVPAVNTVGDRDWDECRYGRMGIFGNFDVNQPPTLDALGVTDTSQTVFLDVIKVG